MNLDNKVVVLTGATGGIGQEIARQLAARGSRIALTGRNREKLEALQKELEQKGAKIIATEADLTKAEDRSKLVEQTEQNFGEIDILINNAGSQHMALFQTMEPEAIVSLFQTNLLAPILLVRELLPAMIDRGQGQLVNIGSTFGSIGFAGYTTYSASKFALRGFSEALRRELTGTGVGVTYIAPRGTKTALNSDALYKVSKKLGFHFDKPEDVASQIVRAIELERKELFVGFPEKLFARLNGLIPGIIDSGTAKQMTMLKEFLKIEGEGNA